MATTPRQLREPLESDAYISSLTKLYRDVAFGVMTAILVFSRTQDKRKLENKVDSILSSANTETRSWIEKYLPIIYMSGIIYASNSIKRAGLQLKVPATEILGVDNEIIKTLSEQTYTTYLEAIKGVKRQTMSRITEIQRANVFEKLAQNTDILKTGQTLARSSKDIASLIRDEGIVSLKDKLGRNIRIDSYAEMVARTEQTTIHNEAVKTRMLANGQDLVKVTEHGGSCPLCVPYEGRIYSLTGATAGYPTLDETTLFHPNCRHSYEAISEWEAEDERGELDERAMERAETLRDNLVAEGKATTLIDKFLDS